jgi:hypothetical protein
MGRDLVNAAGFVGALGEDKRRALPVDDQGFGVLRALGVFKAVTGWGRSELKVDKAVDVGFRDRKHGEITSAGVIVTDITDPQAGGDITTRANGQIFPVDARLTREFKGAEGVSSGG